MENYIDGTEENFAVFDAIVKAKHVLMGHRKIVVSISGGSDSDIVIDICEKVKGDKKIQYIWFNTGIEYQATKDHLDFLEKKYGVTITRLPPIKPIPNCVREYGVPFLSKNVSEMLSRLQKYGFKFEDKPEEELLQEYPKCKRAVKWWCNTAGKTGKRFNIDYNKHLKDFLISNPPTIPISNKCCIYGKKKPAKEYLKKSDEDLNVYGVRRSEGGTRATAYKECYTHAKRGSIDTFRPIFWLTDNDKKFYEKKNGVTHSACYTKYGLKRTGCVGCPYGKDVEDELKSMKMFEPKLYNIGNFALQRKAKKKTIPIK